MESHPVPQNVTAFEFHLVGDMTVKQFIYLAVGIAASYIIFISLASLIPFLAWPMLVFTGLSGAAFAFLPISERPLDHWVGAFFKAIMTPTQRTWSKKSIKDPQIILPNRLKLYLAAMRSYGPGMASEQTNVSIMSQMAPVTQQIVNKPLSLQNPATAQFRAATQAAPQRNEILPSQKELSETVTLAKRAQEIQTRIVNTEHELNQIKTQAAVPGTDQKEFAGQFQTVLSDLQTLTTQASQVSNEMAVISKTTPPTQARQATQVIRKPVTTNIILTQVPNLVNGIITDSVGNYLEGVIVVTHNAEGLPVRALKTNKLGQFVAATPLPNGKYMLSLEKENLLFDSIEIELKGQIMPALVASAKKVGPNP